MSNALPVQGGPPPPPPPQGQAHYMPPAQGQFLPGSVPPAQEIPPGGQPHYGNEAELISFD